MAEQQPGLPIRAALHETGLYLMLRQIAPSDLTDPFLFETVARLPGPDKFVLTARDRLGAAPPRTRPTGMIFHMSRSGSTLLSQVLKQVPGLVVYSEPLPFNEILLPPHRWPRADLVNALRIVGAALSRHAGGRPYVVKFSSWNTLFCDLLAEAFPDTPYVFSHRHPAEIAVSLRNSEPGWFRDSDEGRRLRAIVDPQGASTSPEDYAARAIGALCEAALQLDPQKGRLVGYDQLPAAFSQVLAPQFGLALDDATRARMAEAATINAKAPGTVFVPDAARKRAAATPTLLAAVERFARPPLRRLLATHSKSRGNFDRS